MNICRCMENPVEAVVPPDIAALVDIDMEMDAEEDGSNVSVLQVIKEFNPFNHIESFTAIERCSIDSLAPDVVVLHYGGHSPAAHGCGYVLLVSELELIH